MWEAASLAMSPCVFVGLMIWRQRRVFGRTRQQIRALPEVTTHTGELTGR
jgi:uncharacterized iron-regulated membrane protein